MNLHKEKPALFSLLSCMIISLLIVLSYWPTLSGDFILDDNPLVKDNPLITRVPSIQVYLSQEDGATLDGDGGTSHTGYYRPLINLTYWMDYQLWGLRASGFRATNLILHIINCLVFFSLVVLLFGDRRKALLITILFSLHPVHTEAVSWVSSRNNVLVSLFSLSSLYFYVMGCRKGSYRLVLLSALLFAAGLLSKEFALMTIPLIILYHRTLAGKQVSLRMELASYSPFVIVFAAYLLLRVHTIGSVWLPSTGASLWERIGFSPYIVMMNLRCVLLPFGLHSFIQGYPGDLLDWKALAGFVTVGLYGLLLWKKRGDRLFVFCAVSFLITLFPVLHIVKTSAVTLVSMRWLYFPASFLLMALLCTAGGLWAKRRNLLIVITACLAAYLGAYSHVLNKELWHNEATFFRQEVVHFQNSFYLGGLAENLSSQGRRQEAELLFHKAIEQSPGEAKNYLNFAGLLLDVRRPAEALECLARAEGLLVSRQERGQFHNNLGVALFGLQRREDALKNFGKAVIFAPEKAVFWKNFGAAYGLMGDYENSISVLERGMGVVSNPVPLQKVLAVSCIHSRAFEKALSILASIPLEERGEDPEISGLLSQAREGLRSSGSGKAVD